MFRKLPIIILVLSMAFAGCNGGIGLFPTRVFPGVEPTVMNPSAVDQRTVTVTAAAPRMASPTSLIITKTATKAPLPIITVPPSLPTYQIPVIIPGKINIAVVMEGTHNDGGWSQSHYKGLIYVRERMPESNIVLFENVDPREENIQIFRAIARKGYGLALGLSMDFTTPMEAASREFPETMFIVINGKLSNGKNFGSLYGARETMKYMVGMLSGARAQKDGKKKIGYVTTFITPEEVRVINAIGLGMRKTCPDCMLEVAWTNNRKSPNLERKLMDNLMDSGVQVIITGGYTQAAVESAAIRGKWAVSSEIHGSCSNTACLTASYWNWGPVYLRIIEGIKAKTYLVGSDYFDAKDGGLGLYGMMEGQPLTRGMAELPQDVLDRVRVILADSLKGDFDRFSVFSGPIRDRLGIEIISTENRLTQNDLDQFPPGVTGLECTKCMYWLAEGVNAELPKVQK